MLVPLEGVKKVLTPVPFPAYLGLKAEEGKGSQTEGFDLVPPHGLVDGAARHSSRARNERSGKGDRGLGRTKQATMPLSLHALRRIRFHTTRSRPTRTTIRARWPAADRHLDRSKGGKYTKLVKNI